MPIRLRRITRKSEYIHEPDASHSILISDSAADQHLITTIWTIVHRTGRYVLMTGAFAGRNVGERFEVVSAVAKLTDRDGRSFAAYIHEALYDANPAQVESLLSTHQALRLPTVRIDDRSVHERDIHDRPGTQQSKFGDHSVGFYFDGVKCFYEISSISHDERMSLPRIDLSDAAPFDPNVRQYSRRTTVGPNDCDWTLLLGAIPQHVVDKTLRATTQMVATVEAETREIMRDHFQTRLPELKVKRVNDQMNVDTFFSSVKSIRGYQCWNLFSFKDSGYDFPVLMRRRSQSPESLQTCITVNGAPRLIKTDNAPEFKSKRWMATLNRLLIAIAFTEPHHPNENLSERRGGALKAAVVHIMSLVNMPHEFWCFALEYVALLRTHIARRSLNWRTSHECHFGETPDISRFRFPLWHPIWYYTPRTGFPRRRMHPGRFLGVARNAGDAFCYLILTEPTEDGEAQVLTRSVIRMRYPRETAPVVESNQGELLRFYKRDGTTPLELVDESGSDDIDPLSDVLDAAFTPPTTCNHPADTDDTDLLRESIASVLGPPTKRRRPNPPSEASAPLIVPEEPLQVSTSESTPSVTTGSTRTMNPVPLSQPATNADEAEVSIRPVTVPNTAEYDDGHVPVNNTDSPDDRPSSVPITQDDDENDSVDLSNGVSRQLTSIAGDADDVDELFDCIAGHEWSNGTLFFELLWKTNETSIQPFSIVKQDFPQATADYILKKKVGSSDGRYATGRYMRWARSFNREVKRILRRVTRLQYDAIESTGDLPPNPLNVQDHYHSSGERLIRRTPTKTGTPSPKKRKNPGRNRRPRAVKYGVTIPTSVNDAYRLDEENKNTFWSDAIKKEISSLISLDCFAFEEPGYKPSDSYQFCPLTMIFEAKQDGRRKARLVAGGHVVDASDISVRSTVVKGISVRALDLIAHRDNLTTLVGDIGNAFITADCLEKVYSRAGPEFGDKQDAILLVNKAIYGLRSSSRAFRCHFAEFLRSLGFVPTMFDRDVWMRLRDSESDAGYDYICTHVDDFKIVARDPQHWMSMIEGAFLIKSQGPPDYYLGNNYTYSPLGKMWLLGCHTYIKECIRRLESDEDINGKLWPKKTPLPEGCHPEVDETDLLDDAGTRKYQMLIGMAQWACTIGRLDISFAVSSLSRFSANPRQGHLELAIYLFGYLKKFPNRRIVLNSKPLVVSEELKNNSFHPDFLEDYPDAKEDIDARFPVAYGDEFETSIFFDADHAHDQRTRRSISGLLIFIGSTPVAWRSKRQGCIATSTYCAEFMAMRTAVEEAISLRYMLRCFGCKVTTPTRLYGDNLGCIQSASIPDGELKKKHIAISYHYVREAIAAQIVNATWCKTHENWSDLCTKALGSNTFNDLVNDIMS